MKAVARAMVVMGLLLGSYSGATAQEVKWTLDDIDFNNGNTASGYFVTDYNSSASPFYRWSIVSFSITVGDSAPGAAFTAAGVDSPYLPGEIGIYSAGWSKYVDLYLTSLLTTAGGVVSISSGYDCPGCGVLLTGSGHDPTVDGVPLPEPTPILLLGIGLGCLGISLRRNLLRAS